MVKLFLSDRQCNLLFIFQTHLARESSVVVQPSCGSCEYILHFAWRLALKLRVKVSVANLTGLHFLVTFHLPFGASFGLAFTAHPIYMAVLGMGI